jgi:hypothetical protein
VRLLELFGDNVADFIAEVESLGPALPQDIQDALRKPAQ